jgi:hypothetical protein
MHNMIVPSMRKNPYFYDAYWNARLVTIYGVRHNKKETPVVKTENVA